MKPLMRTVLLLVSLSAFPQDVFFLEAAAGIEPAGFLFREEILPANGLDLGLAFGIPAGPGQLGIAGAGAYRSFGSTDTLNGALIWARGGLFYRAYLAKVWKLQLEAGGGWHRGAWTGTAGTFAQNEALAYARMEAAYDLGFLNLLARAEGSVFFVQEPVIQPVLELGAGMDLFWGWSVAALAKGGFWSHPRDPESFSYAPLAELRLEARWSLEWAENTKPPVSELENQFDRAAVGDSLSVDTILFLPNSAELDAVSLPVLEDILRFLERRPAIGLEIQGFANPVGRPEAERLLSEQRANTVRNWFLEKGVDSARLRAVGKGSVATGEDAGANRRVIFIILLQEAGV